jgi:hypothetical protein
MWSMGKHALAQAARMTVPRDHPLARHQQDPDRLPDHILLPSGEVLRIAVFDEPRYKAISTVWQNNLVAGVYHGIPLALPGLCVSFWADPRVATWIGDTSRLNPPKILADEEVPFGLEEVMWGARDGHRHAYDTRLMHRVRDRLRGQYQSLCSVRRAAAAHMINAAFLFLWHHEFAHLLLGHIDGIWRDFGVDAVREIVDDSAQDDVPPMLSQIMEIQADTLALNFTLGQGQDRLNRALTAGTADDPLPADAPNTPLTPRQLSMVTSMACLIPWLIFQMYRQFGAHPESVQSHPPLMFRTWMVLQNSKERWADSPQCDDLWCKLLGGMTDMARTHPRYTEWFGGLAEPTKELELYRYKTNVAHACKSLAANLEFPSRVHPSRL